MEIGPSLTGCNSEEYRIGILYRGAGSAALLAGRRGLRFALRLRSIEGFKTALRRDFGQLLGLPRVPTVQTVRTRLRALAASAHPALVMRKLVEAWVQLEPVWEGAYYLDGHFNPTLLLLRGGNYSVSITTLPFVCLAAHDGSIYGGHTALHVKLLLPPRQSRLDTDPEP